VHQLDASIPRFRIVQQNGWVASRPFDVPAGDLAVIDWKTSHVRPDLTRMRSASRIKHPSKDAPKQLGHLDWRSLDQRALVVATDRRAGYARRSGDDHRSGTVCERRTDPARPWYSGLRRR
jgi:hypothetical protein